MSLDIYDDSLPLAIDRHGVVRVAKTRVTLDTIVAAFNAGLNAEKIVEQYPVVQLCDVYTVIGYYLRHQAEVDAYLAMRELEAKEIRAENERRFNPIGIRARLVARKMARE